MYKRIFAGLLAAIALTTVGLTTTKFAGAESAWAPSSFEEMMGGNKVATFDGFYKDGRTAQLSINLSKESFGLQVGSYTLKATIKARSDGGFCLEAPNVDKCYQISRNGSRFSINHEGEAVWDELERR